MERIDIVNQKFDAIEKSLNRAFTLTLHIGLLFTITESGTKVTFKTDVHHAVPACNTALAEIAKERRNAHLTADKLCGVEYVKFAESLSWYYPAALDIQKRAIRKMMEAWNEVTDSPISLPEYIAIETQLPLTLGGLDLKPSFVHFCDLVTEAGTS